MHVPAIAALAPSSPVKSICVFCGAREGGDPAYLALAQSLGRAAARAHLDLIYGGGGAGLMGAVARAAIGEGGRVTGIIPSFLIPHEDALELDHELLVVEEMSERKLAMAARADAFIALPGGLGTLEELIEQISWAKLRRHTKPIILLDSENFWRPLIDMFKHMAAAGFCDPAPLGNVVLARDADDAIARLVAYPAAFPHGHKVRRLRTSPLLSEFDAEAAQHEVFHCPAYSAHFQPCQRSVT